MSASKSVSDRTSAVVTDSRFLYVGAGKAERIAVEAGALFLTFARGAGVVGCRREMAFERGMVLFTSRPERIVRIEAMHNGPVIVGVLRLRLPQARSLSWSEMPVIGFGDEQRGLRPLTNYIHGCFQREKPPAPSVRRMLGELLLVELERWRTSGASALSRRDLLVRRAQEFVETNFGQPLSTKELAAFLQCDPSTVHRHFKMTRGQSPGEWVRRFKVRKACHFLRSTTLTIAEVADMVGIEDPFYFSRLFRLHEKCSPTEYRRRTSCGGFHPE